ncbi:26S proteasome non-ATPase regulatory subunit 4 [Armadillidium nasatum]|uniref:26S proteasome non-ATPase regulatory subunit 4 n=1 Tax=Armadillidium nasatum TaxID=96803 RepID=A0A5N5SYQ1_9CRUS|nr:26S proteasome non-ATPase regulatory subunit 4 [Armadillidium nasatum]
MPLESTVICVDNSEYMRNGDYIPNRLQAQQDAVNTVCRYKLLANPENNVGLLTLANTEVLATLTTDGGKILTSLHKVQPSGYINLLTGIRIAHLALKHRQSKNHKMRIVVFVGSPISVEEKEVIKIAKRLKKENVNVDIINFGETDQNQTLLEAFVNTMNGREGTGSHLVTVPPSPRLSDALLSSPIIQGEDGSGPTNFGSGNGFEFGVDPNEDPELALALRVSMEEQRQRQQEEERRTAQESAGTEGTPAAATATTGTAATADSNTTAAKTASASSPMATGESTEAGVSEEEMLQQALAMSLESGGVSGTAAKEPANPISSGESKDEAMDVDKEEENVKDKEEKAEPDFSQVMSDPAFLQDVLQSLPGVDPQSKVVRQAVGSLTGQDKEKDKTTKTDKKKKEDKNDDKK